MVEHQSRAHAEWAASASARNAVCAGAIAMCSMVDGKESEAAAWGTACHELAHEYFDAGVIPKERRGQTIEIGRFKFEIDDEMVDVTEGWLDRCHEEIAANPGCLFWVEEPLPLDKLNPPLQAGGTSDLTIYIPSRKLIKQRDLKTGRGVFVDAKGSWQQRSYALGVVLNHPELDVEDVEVTIDQPRLQRGGDGGVRSETFHAADLFEWAATMLAAMARAKQAKDDFEKIGGNRVLFDEWAEKWLTTGQCTFCDAKALCPKVREEALASLPQVAQKWFETPDDARPPELSNATMLLSTEELEHALNGLEVLEAWANAVRDRGHSEASRGVKFKDWMLVDKIGNRAWKDEKKAVAELGVLGLTEAQIFEKKLLSPAKADTALKKAKRKPELIADLWTKPVRGVNLVRRDKTDRPPAQSTTEKHHEVVE